MTPIEHSGSENVFLTSEYRPTIVRENAELAWLVGIRLAELSDATEDDLDGD